ncbi:hypothetical protein BJY01DRAFT_250717 [Aspergillus pseudoustus]|uniref:Uncharacterized protein n=1 Tax=Aspergillus pseudoustus TaxID=1810923 RepID=A0ABR4JHC8_9EURO
MPTVVLLVMLEPHGNKIVEVDITVLCIRLASDILYGKVTLPAPTNPSTLLAQHEAILLREARALLLKCSGSFRSPDSNRYPLPHYQALVEAIGHRAALEAAAATDIDPMLLMLYEIGVVKSDLACYVG